MHHSRLKKVNVMIHPVIYIYIYIVGLVLLRNVGCWNGSIKSNLSRIGSFDLIEPCQYHMQLHAFITIFLA